MTDTPTDMIGPATFDAQDVTGPSMADAPDKNGPATRVRSEWARSPVLRTLKLPMIPWVVTTFIPVISGNR
jgi:hypothetical protein